MASGVPKSGTSNGYPVKAQLQIIGMCSVFIVHADSLSLSYLTGNEQNRAIVNVIRNTCAFPAMMSQNICCGKMATVTS